MVQWLPNKRVFPPLFVIIDSKDEWVANMREDESELGHWSLCFSRQCYDWELEMMEAFLRRIQKHSIKREMENRMTWSVSKN